MQLSRPFIIGLIAGIVFGALVTYYFFPQTKTITQTVEKEVPIYIKGETQTKTEYVLVEPEQQGEVTRIINKDGKVFIVVNGQEYELKSKTDQDTKLSENGTVQVTQQTIAKTDISDLFNKALQLELEKERKNNTIEIGLGYHNDWYVPISYQRNISKNKAIEVEIHKELKFNTNIAGGEVKSVIKF